jgi:4-amino-4-deoxy-L-arabinose transferase-like glycosyltransferase
MKLTSTLLISFFLLLFVGLVLLPNSPLLGNLPNRDSGVFLYAGSQILEGKIPYHDFWDHKPPGIFYINALGLLIGGGSQWGVWVLECLSLWATMIIGFFALKRAFGGLAAVVGMAGVMTTAVWLFQRGNLTEEYLLPIQFLTLYFFIRLQPENIRWGGLILGVLMGLSFFLRQNLIGLHICILIVLGFSSVLGAEKCKAGMAIVQMLVGFAAVTAVVFLYFASHNALDDFWAAAFQYNFSYSGGTSIVDKLSNFWKGLRTVVSYSGVPLLAIAGWLAAIPFVWFSRDRLERWKLALLVVALLNMPLEFLLSGVSGEDYPHYYLTWLLSFSIFLAFVANQLIDADLTKFSVKETLQSKSWWGIALVISMIVVSLGLWFDSYIHEVLGARHRDTTVVTMQDYLRSNTAEDDYVLMWGAESIYHYLTGRPAPTRFVYQYALLLNGYSHRAEYAQEFLEDIQTNPPVFIIDSSNFDNLVPPLDAERRKSWTTPNNRYVLIPELDPIFDYIDANYELDTNSNMGVWNVYRLIEQPSS